MDEKQIKLDGQNGGTDIPYVNSAEVVGLITIRNSAAILRQLVDFARQWKISGKQQLKGNPQKEKCFNRIHWEEKAASTWKI